MNRKAKIFNHGILAGFIEEIADGYKFYYDKQYLMNPHLNSISLLLPKKEDAYFSEYLFPFFHGLLAEGVTKDIQCKMLKLDEEDDFGRLLKTAGSNVIGSVTVEEMD